MTNYTYDGEFLTFPLYREILNQTFPWQLFLQFHILGINFMSPVKSEQFDLYFCKPSPKVNFPNCHFLKLF